MLKLVYSKDQLYPIYLDTGVKFWYLLNAQLSLILKNQWIMASIQIWDFSQLQKLDHLNVNKKRKELTKMSSSKLVFAVAL